MTKEQKEQVIKLRQTGYGYATIADALGLTKNQVSAFCRRNHLTGIKAQTHVEEKPAASCCKNCGKPITQVPGRKLIKFCSPDCRQNWWNAHADMVNKKAIIGEKCTACGQCIEACPVKAIEKEEQKYRAGGVDVNLLSENERTRSARNRCMAQIPEI